MHWSRSPIWPITLELTQSLTVLSIIQDQCSVEEASRFIPTVPTWGCASAKWNSLWVEGELTLDKMRRTYHHTIEKIYDAHAARVLVENWWWHFIQSKVYQWEQWVSSQSTCSLGFAMTCGELVDMNLMSIINWLIHTLDLHTTVLRQWSRAWFHFVPIIMTLYLFLLMMS